ncbi:DgyrCDS7236 [Dimorphilus gyrociliatus]|uniref:DgyrCDS7236 n=1 Tax=Dimorphilus gyrociliatus TaxID=2664684 RepID=A0A7I8VVF2_9ANNE|nr:DgyrCDS7236 [Dimorphilus gyrociliatus]
MEVRKRSNEKPMQAKTRDSRKNGSTKLKKLDNQIGMKIWLIIILLNLAFLLFAHSRNFVFPEPKTIDKSSDGEFIEEIARSHLVNITDIGVRTVGSVENEVTTVEYLLSTLRKYREGSANSHTFEIISERSSGSYTLDALGASFGQLYENVNNIAVRLRPKSGTNHDLLVNCHYDSQIGAPGASDDVVSCALMLEVLRILSKSPENLNHGIIFLFNGAEETILQASHGFITQHPWAKTIRAFVNLEAAGAGGRELLFQAGPGTPWLLDTYAKSAPHPFAAVFGQELFQSGIIPSDTDFRIFRDHGGLSGLDIAYIHNGYVYHTIFDDPSRIPTGCIQRGGENLLAVVKAIANSSYLSKPSEFKKDPFVFFDFYGYFMIVYPSSYGLVLNCTACAIVLLEVINRIFGFSKRGVGRSEYIKAFLVGLLAQIIALFASLLLSFSVAFLLTKFNKVLSWYTNTWLLFPLYVAPSFLSMIAVHNFFKGKLETKNNSMDIEEIVFESTIFIFTILLFVATLFKIDSAVLLFLTVLPPILIKVHGSSLLSAEKSLHVLKLRCFLHILSISIPLSVGIYFIYNIYAFFVPLFGRTGNGIPPDYVIAVLTTILSYFCLCFQMSLVYVTKCVKKLMLLLAGLLVLGLLLVFFTNMGFPYSANKNSPSTQRLIVQHAAVTERKGNSLNKIHSGLWISSFDYYGIQQIEKNPMVAKATHQTCKVEEPYCGQPFYFPITRMIKHSYWIPGDSPNIEPAVHLEEVKRIETETGVRVYFKLDGPERRVISIRPDKDVELTAWSLSNRIGKPALVSGGFKNYFIFYVYGTRPKTPTEFWCEFKGITKTTKNYIKIGVTGHHVQGKNNWSKLLQEFSKSLPDTISPIIVSSDQHLYNF